LKNALKNGNYFERIRPFVLPFALLLGFLFHSSCIQLQFLTPWLIFFILFMTLCDLDLKEVRIKPLHIWLVVFQIVAAIAVYVLLLPVNKTLAQGAFMGIFAPVAVSSAVIAVMLGAKLDNMVSFTILSNLTVAVTAPVILSFIGGSDSIPFWDSALMIVGKVAPVIILPLVAAFICQNYFPKTRKAIVRFKTIPFYLWAFALTLVTGQTIDFISRQDRSGIPLLLAMLVVSLGQCVLHFSFGSWLGKKYGDSISGSQSLGQKNFLLAIWISQMFLSPLASVVPASYVLWQNLWNSWQLWQVKKKEQPG